MKRSALVVVILAMWLALAGAAWAEDQATDRQAADRQAKDQAKAEKRLRQISAMAGEPVARGIINRAMAETVHAKRIELQRQRHAMNLSYGALFIAHAVQQAGTPMLDVALELERGKTIEQIADEHRVNWKVVGDGAKKLEDKIEDGIFAHFQTPKDKLGADEKYDVAADVVAADSAFSAQEFASARDVYVFWRNKAAGPRGGSLDSSSQTMLGKSQDSLDRGDRRPE